MKNKWKLANFLSDYCSGEPPRNIYNALCKFEDEEENLSNSAPLRSAKTNKY